MRKKRIIIHMKNVLRLSFFFVHIKKKNARSSHEAIVTLHLKKLLPAMPSSGLRTASAITPNG